jgi:hypothetical protein
MFHLLDSVLMPAQEARKQALLPLLLPAAGVTSILGYGEYNLQVPWSPAKTDPLLDVKGDR